MGVLPVVTRKIGLCDGTIDQPDVKTIGYAFKCYDALTDRSTLPIFSISVSAMCIRPIYALEMTELFQ